MRFIRVIAPVLVILGLATPAVTVAGGEEVMKEVTAIGDALATAMVAQDVDTLLAMYAEDAISLPNYGPRMDGIDEFRQHHADMAAAGMKVTAFASSPTDVWKAGDQIVEIGTYAITLEVAGMPQPMEDKGKYLTIYVRDKAGKLKIKAETWNTDMNPMAMGAAGH